MRSEHYRHWPVGNEQLPRHEETTSEPTFGEYLEALQNAESPHDAMLDTYGLQLDGFLERIHAAEAYFEDHPEVQAIEIPSYIPDEDDPADPDTFVLDRSTIYTLKEMASLRYEDLMHLSDFGHKLARDIVKSWDGFTMDWQSLLSELHAELPEYQKDLDQSG